MKAQGYDGVWSSCYQLCVVRQTLCLIIPSVLRKLETAQRHGAVLDEFEGIRVSEVHSDHRCAVEVLRGKWAALKPRRFFSCNIHVVSLAHEKWGSMQLKVEYKVFYSTWKLIKPPGFQQNVTFCNNSNRWVITKEQMHVLIFPWSQRLVGSHILTDKKQTLIILVKCAGTFTGLASKILLFSCFLFSLYLVLLLLKWLWKNVNVKCQRHKSNLYPCVKKSLTDISASRAQYLRMIWMFGNVSVSVITGPLCTNINASS